MACVEQRAPALLRLGPTVLAVPRSSNAEDRDKDDLRVVHTPAFVTPLLDREGWLLARYVKGVLVEAFGGFTPQVHRGDLPEMYCNALRDALRLP
jgi:hypothetical protein